MGNKPACKNCAVLKLAQRCISCNQPIVGQVITVFEKSYHPQCLRCTVCKNVLTNYEKIYKKDNNPVCPTCVQSVFSMVVLEDPNCGNRASQQSARGSMRGNTNSRGAPRGNTRGNDNSQRVRGGRGSRGARGSIPRG